MLNSFMIIFSENIIMNTNLKLCVIGVHINSVLKNVRVTSTSNDSFTANLK